MIEDVDSARVQETSAIVRRAFDDDVRAGLFRIRNDLELLVPQDVFAARALPARDRNREHVRKAEQQPGLVRNDTVLEQPEQFLRSLDALDVVEVLQRRLGAPAQEQA